MNQPQQQPLPPIRAKDRGKSGRKHIVGQRRVNEAGRVEVYLTCPHSQCRCGGWFSAEDLFLSLEDEEKEKGKEQEAA